MINIYRNYKKVAVRIWQLKFIASAVAALFIAGCTTTSNESAPLIPTSTTAEFATQDPIALLVIGKRAYNSNHFDLAERALLESTKLSSTVIDAHLYLGNLYFLSDRYSLSQNQYAKALKLDPSNLIARNNTMLIHLRQAEKSLSQLENTLQEHNKGNGHIRNLLVAIDTFLKPGQKAKEEKAAAISIEAKEQTLIKHSDPLPLTTLQPLKTTKGMMTAGSN